MIHYPGPDSNPKAQAISSIRVTNGVSKVGDAAKPMSCCNKPGCHKSQPKNSAGDVNESSSNQMAEKAKKHDEKGAADLERVTDYFDEKELMSGSNSGGNSNNKPFHNFESISEVL